MASRSVVVASVVSGVLLALAGLWALMTGDPMLLLMVLVPVGVAWGVVVVLRGLRKQDLG